MNVGNMSYTSGPLEGSNLNIDLQTEIDYMQQRDNPPKTK